MFSLRQNNSRSYFASWGKIDKAQKYMLCIIIPFLDSFRIQIAWFQPKQDSDRIWISFFINKIGSDSKNHYPIISVTSIYVLDLRGSAYLFAIIKYFSFAFFLFIPFATQLFSTPLTSSNLRNQAPLFTELRFLQATKYAKNHCFPKNLPIFFFYIL